MKAPKTAEEQYIDLGWKLLLWKGLYYNPCLFSPEAHKLKVEDEEYDVHEATYKALAKQLNLPASASVMVGFDMTRPSCRLVLSKWGKK
jgi:hypothetical protein